MTWVPNGLGAGVDNSVAGGGGGFMSLPQPPSPGGVFNPTGKGGSQDNGNSWNGGFGPTNVRFNNTIGTDFSISNPGRSA